jgi:hypothetical protein
MDRNIQFIRRFSHQRRKLRPEYGVIARHAT